MKRIYSISIATACLVIFGSGTLSAKNIAEVKTLCPAGESAVVTGHFIIEGVVVSDCRSLNVELNPNTAYNEVDLSVNDRTAYLQEADGSAGLKLLFNDCADNSLERYDRVSIDLFGCTVNHLSKPDRICVEGIDYTSVVSYSKGSADGVTVKQKHIDELQDSDVYTMVTLQNAEMVFKSGTYADIYEGYAQFVPGYPYCGVYLPNLRMDGWASLLRDSRGGSIYMLVNTRCNWRRDGSGVFSGMGPVSGIIVHTPMRRYGGEMGCYSLRPIYFSDIVSSKKTKSSWKTLTAWKPDGSAGTTMFFESAGEVTNLKKKGKKGDRLMSDSGSAQGLLWTDSNSAIHVDNDLNALTSVDRGTLKNGAICLKGSTSDWFEFDSKGKPTGAKSVYLQFSAKKAKGSVLQLSFSWLAGDTKGKHNLNYPAEWKVEYTFDKARDWSSSDLGELNWTTLEDNATRNKVTVLRSHPFSSIKSGKDTRMTGYDCGLGMQQHSYNLPSEAIGKDNVIIRITPATYKLSAIRKNPAKDVLDTKARAKSGTKDVTWIRFGEISVDYE